MVAQKWEMSPENTFHVGSLAADMAATKDSGQGSVSEQQEKTQGWQGIGVQTKAQAHSTAQTSAEARCVARIWGTAGPGPMGALRTLWLAQDTHRKKRAKSSIHLF